MPTRTKSINKGLSQKVLTERLDGFVQLGLVTFNHKLSLIRSLNLFASEARILK